MRLTKPHPARHSPGNMHETMSGLKTAHPNPRIVSPCQIKRERAARRQPFLEVKFPLSAKRSFSHRE